MRKLLYTALVLLSFIQNIKTQTNPAINPKLLKYAWSSNWISYPDDKLRDYGVYHFRKILTINALPDSFIIHVSGDNRYKLYVNGTYICNGPARGDVNNWHYETVDIKPYLQTGKNVLAAVVWNQGEYKPVAQMTTMTAFVVQGNDKNTVTPSRDEAEGIKGVNTNRTWKVLKNSAYTPVSTDNMSRLQSYVVVGCGDKIDAAQYPWGWESIDYDDSAWPNARPIGQPIPIGAGSGAKWHITPRTIPLMEMKEQRFAQIRRGNNDSEVLKGQKPMTIPANTQVKILIDNGVETVAYPVIKTSGGKDASIRLDYAEALVDDKKQKGNRNDIEGKILRGFYDIFLPDGGNRSFSTLWIRTFRYIELTIETKDNPLIINDIYSVFSAYPFVEKATFSSNDDTLKDIWQVGWRTARLCAGETYFDCPYYEQLQYVGDTRIQALISLYMTGDDRLVRKAITDFHNSMVQEGLTQSRYPCDEKQIIPPFSLFWVSMVHDYWMHRRDDAFIKQFLPAVQQVLAWYERHIDPSKNMLGGMPWWNFVDWADEWDWNPDAAVGGTPEGATYGHSVILTLQFAYTLKQAAPIFKYFNRNTEGIYYEKLANQIASATYQKCFDSAKGVMADSPLKKQYSQHASVMAVLGEAIPEAQRKAVLNKILTDKSLIQMTFYYHFYLNQALKKAGMAELYYKNLQPWKDMLKIGLTTFAEKPEPTRSDCHAWSASPNYDLLATVCGIMPLEAGFSKVKIQPAMGELTDIQGSMPHPLGDIKMNLKKKNTNGVSGEVILPKGLTGVFIWQGKTIPLKEGQQKIDF
jgi:alpha-L-rhamnosidase